MAHRRRTIAAILAFALAAAAPVRAQVGTRIDAPPRAPRRPRLHALPSAVDLAADAADSRRRRVPILILFDREDCPYCERALREHLVPMSHDAPWREDALFRQVEVDQARPVVDFDGSATTHRALAARYAATLTPTIVVVDAAGAPLAEPVVGLLTADFYGAYLEDALKKGLAKLRA
jgi:thioredoxin-related protein